MVTSVVARLLRRKVRNDDRVIRVIHRDPGRYSSFLSSSLPWNFKGQVYTIGRSMFESDSIPDHWVRPANNLVDEIWVPSAFNVDTFANSGVPVSKYGAARRFVRDWALVGFLFCFCSVSVLCCSLFSLAVVPSCGSSCSG